MPLSLSERLWNWRHRRIPDAQIREYTRVEFDADRERDGKATRVWIDEATIVEQRAEIERLLEENKRLEKLLADEGICLTCGCRGCDCQEGDQ
jgi:hypothetical protein